MDSNSEDEAEQIRISLILAAGVNDSSLEVPSEPIAVPSSIRRRGLSALVNHLLDRDVKVDKKKGGVDESDDEDSDSESEDKLPSIPFDFIVNRKLLRVSVEAAVRREGLSLEEAVEIRYFPALNAPEGEGNSEVLPDWISAMSFHYSLVNGNKNKIENGNNMKKGMNGLLCTGCYDGSIHIFDCKNGVKEIASVKAHTGAIKCLSSISTTNNGSTTSLVATGSMDQTLLTHTMNTSDESYKLNLHTIYSGGHFNSIESVALLYNNSSHSTVMASGDWDGGLCLWKVPMNSDETNKESNYGSKKRRTTKDKANANANAKDEEKNSIEIQPTSSWKAHISSISSLSWSYSSSSTSNNINNSSSNLNHLISSSWDHSLKVWDVQQEECLLTLNGSRVISCMNRCSNSDVVATGHPDCTVRLWDMRTGNEENKSSSVSDGSLKPSHKSWVSSIQWSPKEPHVLATNSHDGCVKMWDIRSSLPLHTIKAHGEGRKGLCLAYTEKYLFSGGSDCKVQKFALK